MYGAIDEWLQEYVGRNCDWMDFGADVIGLAAGLVILSFFNFWGSFLIVTGIGIFLLTNLAKKNPAELMPITNILFHFFGYGTFALLWIRQMKNIWMIRPPQIKWLAIALIIPWIFLLTMKLSAVIFKSAFSGADFIFSAAGIVGVVTVVYAAGLFGRKRGTD